MGNTRNSGRVDLDELEGMLALLTEKLAKLNSDTEAFRKERELAKKERGDDLAKMEEHKAHLGKILEKIVMHGGGKALELSETTEKLNNVFMRGASGVSGYLEKTVKSVGDSIRQQADAAMERIEKATVRRVNMAAVTLWAVVIAILLFVVTISLVEWKRTSDDHRLEESVQKESNARSMVVFYNEWFDLNPKRKVEFWDWVDRKQKALEQSRKNTDSKNEVFQKKE